MAEVRSIDCSDHTPAGKRFHNAVVRIPCPGMVNGLTSANLGRPDFGKALEQHSEYIEILIKCGLSVKILDPDNHFPDSVFIEDVALCTPACAIITNPGAPTRRGEISGIRQVLQEFYTKIEEIILPGTLEAGDVMMVSTDFFIGISGRTNTAGADQLIEILKSHGFSGSKVALKMALHLKSGTSYIENNNMLVTGEFRYRKEFAGFNRIVVDDDEKYAANSLWINGKVLVPEGFPKTRSKIDKAGYETIVLDVSEFRKLDGGLSCLSLRF
jgi:dimethylargininase